MHALSHDQATLDGVLWEQHQCCHSNAGRLGNRVKRWRGMLHSADAISKFELTDLRFVHK